MEATKQELRHIIAANVRSLMGVHKVSQKRIAEALGKSQPAVSRRLSGDHPFDTDELCAIAELFQVTPLRFLDATSDLGVRPSGWTSGSLVPA